MKYVVTLNGTDYEVDVTELSEAIVTTLLPQQLPRLPLLHPQLPPLLSLPLRQHPFRVQARL